MIVAMWGGGNTQAVLAGKKIELHALADGRDTKTFPSFLAVALYPVLVPHYKPPGKNFTT